MVNERNPWGPRAVLQHDGSLLLEVPLKTGQRYRRVIVDRGGKSAGRKQIRKDYAGGRKPTGRR